MKKKTEVTICGGLPPIGVGAQHNPEGGGSIIEIHHTNPPTEVIRYDGITNASTPKMKAKKKK